MILERNIYRFLILGLVLYIMYYRGCVVKPCPGIAAPVNTVKIDTFYKLVHDATPWMQPVPKVIVKHDTLIEYDKLYIIDPVDTAAILTDYMSTVYYEDTARVKYGTVIIKDSITHNRIAARQVSTDFNIPTIKEIRTVQPRLRNQLYIGIGAIGNPKTIIHGVEGMFTLKTKKDQMYEVGALYLGSELYYKAGIKFKFSFK